MNEIDKVAEEVTEEIHGTFANAYAIDEKVNHEWLRTTLKQALTETKGKAEQNGIKIGRDMMFEEMVEKMKVVFGLELDEKIISLKPNCTTPTLKSRPAPKATKSPDSAHSETKTNYLAERGDGEPFENRFVFEIPDKSYPYEILMRLNEDGTRSIATPQDIARLIDDVAEQVENTHCEAGLAPYVGGALYLKREEGIKIEPSPHKDYYGYDCPLDLEATEITNCEARIREAVEDAIKMSDALEAECNRDGDKGTKQWMAFKRFRNTLRDKYLNPTNE